MKLNFSFGVVYSTYRGYVGFIISRIMLGIR